MKFYSNRTKKLIYQDTLKKYTIVETAGRWLQQIGGNSTVAC